MYSCGQKFTYAHRGQGCHGNLMISLSCFFLQGGMIAQHTFLMALAKQELGAIVYFGFSLTAALKPG